MELNGRKRVAWIDVLRGATMITVVMGHCIGFTSNPINRMLLCFHMVLFYFISGMTFSGKKYSTLCAGIKSKAVNIVLPYLCFEILGIGLYYMLSYLHLTDDGEPISLFKCIVGIFLPVGRYGSNVTMGFWFVYDVIVINSLCLIMYFLRKKVALLLFIIVGYFCCMGILDMKLCGRLIIALSFFLMGKFYMNKNALCQMGGGNLFVITVISCIILYFTSFFNEPVLLYKMQIGNMVWFMINSALGIAFMLSLCILIRSNKFLEFIGRNTLTILFCHFAILRFFRMTMNAIFPNMKEIYGEYVWATTPFWLITFTFTLLCSCFFAWAVNRFCPSLIGKGLLKKRITQILMK